MPWWPWQRRQKRSGTAASIVAVLGIRTANASLEFPDLAVAHLSSIGLWEIAELRPELEDRWTCVGKYWEEEVPAFVASYLGVEGARNCRLGDAEDSCLQDRLAAAYTSRPEAAGCPVGMATVRLMHLSIFAQRGCLGDYALCGLQKAALLRTEAFRFEVRLLQMHPKHIFQSRYGWLLFHVIWRLSLDVCHSDGGGVELYLKLCQMRPWMLGCPSKSNPYRLSCKAQPQQPHTLCSGWNISHMHVSINVIARRMSRCLSSGSTLLDLILLLRTKVQELELVARLHLIPPSPHKLHRAGRFLACDRSELSTDFERMHLCEHGGQETMVLPGELTVIVFAASVRRLSPSDCGYLVELHLRVEPTKAPCEFFPCTAYQAHCSEQCGGWDGANFLRFACRSLGIDDDPASDYTDSPASTHSGLGTGLELLLHLVVSCRLPTAPSKLQLVELDGFWKYPADVRLCVPQLLPLRIDSRRPKIAACLKPNFALSGHRKLFDEWMRYHLLLGIDYFFIYDSDGSGEALSAALVAIGLATYTSYFTARLGTRFQKMDEMSRSIGLGTNCIEKLQVNHCVTLAQALGFDWLVYLRNLDKFLHADTERAGPRMLRALLAELGPRSSQILLYRRDCGGQEHATKSESTPVFGRWPRCVSTEMARGETHSNVPLMNLRDTHWAITRTGISHSRAEPVFAPIGMLRAQHFVSSFGVPSAAAGPNPRSIINGPAGDLQDPWRYNVTDWGMLWAAPLLRLDMPLQNFLIENNLPM